MLLLFAAFFAALFAAFGACAFAQFYVARQVRSAHASRFLAMAADQ